MRASAPGAKALAFSDDATASVLIAVDLYRAPRALTEEASRARLGKTVRREQSRHQRDPHAHRTGARGRPPLHLQRAGASATAAGHRQLHVGPRRPAARTCRARRARRPAPGAASWPQGRAGFAANRRVIKDGKWTGFGAHAWWGCRSRPADAGRPRHGRRASRAVLSLRVLMRQRSRPATTSARRLAGRCQELIQQRHPGALALVAIGTGADANPNPRGGGLPDVQRTLRLLPMSRSPPGCAPCGR